MTWQYNGAFFSAAEKTKLAAIEAGATGDQTDAEIRTAVENATDSNVFTDNDHTKLNGVEAAADVTDSTNVDAAGAVMESDIPDQSFTNLLENGDFESWSGGAAAAPDGWSLWNITVVREAGTKKLGTYSTKATPSAASGTLYNNCANPDNYKSRSVILGAWVWSDGANQARLRVYDGVSTTNSDYHTGGSTWEFLTVQHNVAAAPTKVECNCVPDTTGGNDFAYFDGVILVEGEVCPAFSPKPLVDDGVMLHVKTPSAANAAGVQGQICTDASYIYVCVATDTWERAAISTWV